MAGLDRWSSGGAEAGAGFWFERVFGFKTRCFVAFSAGHGLPRPARAALKSGVGEAGSGLGSNGCAR